MNISGLNISMTRGDSEYLIVRCTADPFLSGDTITMTVRDGADGDILFQKIVQDFTDGEARIDIEPSDTASFDFGAYNYDIQLVRASGRVITLIPPKPSKLPNFTLTEEATY